MQPSLPPLPPLPSLPGLKKVEDDEDKYKEVKTAPPSPEDPDEQPENQRDEVCARSWRAVLEALTGVARTAGHRRPRGLKCFTHRLRDLSQ